MNLRNSLTNITILIGQTTLCCRWKYEYRTDIKQHLRNKKNHSGIFSVSRKNDHQQNTHFQFSGDCTGS